LENESLPGRMYWNAHGYYGFPLNKLDELDDPASFSAWKAYSDLLVSARHGNFSNIQVLIDWHKESSDWVLRRAYVKLLGDAGSTKVLQELTENLFPDALLYDQYDYVETMINWGSLEIIPALANLYAAHYSDEDAKFIPARLSRLLEEVPGPIYKFPRHGPALAVASYHQLVMDRYEELITAFGSNNTIVFRGGRLNVLSVAKHILKDLESKRFDEEMRHKFEAMTGLNCKSFYRDHKLQPLAAVSLVEDFLESSDSYKYDEGVRYFFGHRIPD
jgi:hypothetical protein